MVSSEINDILREFLANRPKPSDFLPQRPMDDLQSFFNVMCDTVRKFTPLQIAKIKLEIVQLSWQAGNRMGRKCGKNSNDSTRVQAKEP